MNQDFVAKSKINNLNLTWLVDRNYAATRLCLDEAGGYCCWRHGEKLGITPFIYLNALPLDIQIKQTINFEII